jgi:pimeloyl-ACP methyl ester carboxylesterase
VSPGGASTAPTLHAESVDGVLIAYRVHGAADAAAEAGEARGDAALPPVLLVHGFASNARVTWEGTGWVSALLAAGRTAITLDLRGHGESDKPVDASSYAPALLGADLRAVLDSAGADAVDVVGYSMGNRVISALTEIAPERVRRVVIGGAGPRELFALWDLDGNPQPVVARTDDSEMAVTIGADGFSYTRPTDPSDELPSWKQGEYKLGHQL